MMLTSYTCFISISSSMQPLQQTIQLMNGASKLDDLHKKSRATGSYWNNTNQM